MATILDFSKSASNCPIVEYLNATNIRTSLFSDQYTDALAMLNKYLEALSVDDGDTGHSMFVKSVTDSDNNIFAFIGDRGSGKTSCMLSMASLLLEDSRRVKLVDYGQVCASAFFQIGMIDPSFFDQEHNVLSLFLAKMYQNYQHWLREQDEPTIDQDAQGDLMESFCEAQRHLNFMLDEHSDSRDDLDRLLVFSGATDLKKDIYEVIKNYKKLLKYPDDSKLLLIVDDIDLNIGEGSRMAELIRKYFVQRDIVVLMSVKLDQLAMVKKQEFVEAYKGALQAKLLNTDAIEEMAERYLAKFIPQAHRIFMPTPENLYDLPVKLNDNPEDQRNGLPCKSFVCGEIFQKTRYLFYNSPYSVNSVVPNNLRELSQLVSMLNHLPYYRDEKGEHVYNKSLFKQYFTIDWVENHICLDHQELVKEIVKEDQFSRLNNKVVKILKSQYQSILEKGEQTPEITYILDDGNVVYNISVGDVLAVIYYLSTRCVTEYDQQLFFFLRSLYSMRLYEAYDIMTYNLKADEKKDSKKGMVVLSEEEYKYLSEYDKLVGGSLVNSRITPLLSVTDKAGKDVNLSWQLIACESLQKLYTDCSADWNVAFENGNAQLLELTCLGIYRDAYGSATMVDTGNFRSYRKQPIVAFDKIRESGFYVFDLGALMFNVTRVKDCYTRFLWGETLWKESLKNKDSIWNQFVANTEAEKGPYSESTWKSYSCIRNVEILEKFINHIRQGISSVGKHLEAIEDYLTLYNFYFIYASTFNIQTYDLKLTGKEHYSIYFKFYDVIAQMFKREDKWGNRFMELFYRESIVTAYSETTEDSSMSEK